VGTIEGRGLGGDTNKNVYRMDWSDNKGDASTTWAISAGEGVLALTADRVRCSQAVEEQFTIKKQDRAPHLRGSGGPMGQ
jgi:hypothetical protein